MARKKLNFEEGMQELEMLVRDLEQGTMPLEETFKAYEDAKKLQKQLKKMLDDGDKRIRILTANGTEDFETEE